MQQARPFLMFFGRASEAIDYYVGTFERSAILSMLRYGPGEAGPEGTVHQALFTIAGQEVMVIDAPGKHDFTFTPATSMFVTFSAESELDRACERLAQDGMFLMPLGEYPFSPKFAWVADKFGVSWQLSLAKR